MDGQYYSFEFQPNSTANDVIEIIKKTIGLQEKSRGYALYEVLANTERSLSPEEKVCDVMAKWERYRTVSKKEYQNQVIYYIDNDNNAYILNDIFFFVG